MVWHRSDYPLPCPLNIIGAAKQNKDKVMNDSNRQVLPRAETDSVLPAPVPLSLLLPVHQGPGGSD